MNKRITELYIQTANETADGKEWAIGGMGNAEHFAKLIIKDCIQVAGDNACSPTETPNPKIGMAKLEVVKAIIRHFGVE